MGGLFRTGVRGISEQESAALDALRAAAAMMVFLCHWDARTNDNDFHFGVLGRVGVLIFFVLSGFLIAHSAEGRTAREFFIARLARLWSVAAPIVTGLAVLGIVIGWSYREVFTTTLASITFTNQWWFSDRPGIWNVPYWTLSYEAGFYLIYAAFVFCGARWGLLSCLIVGPKVILLFPVWLLGALIYRTGFRLTVLGIVAAAPCIALLLVIFRGRVLGEIALPDIWKPSANFTHDWNHGLACALIVLSCLTLVKLGPLARPIRWFAGRSFTIYLLHFPIFMAMPPAMNKYLFGVITLTACLAVGSLIEPRAPAWRKILRRALPKFAMRLPAKAGE